MQIQAGFHQYSVVSEFWETTVVCSERVAARVAQIGSPYFRLSRSTSRNPEIWTVASDGALAAPLPTSTEHFTPRGETVSTLGINTDARVIYCISPNSDAWLAQNIVRYVRTLHRLRAVSSGQPAVASALVGFDGKGVAIAGKSRSGKTSLVLALTIYEDGEFIANDDLTIGVGPDGVIGRGGPRSVSIRLDTFGALEDEKAGLPADIMHPANETLSQLIAEGIEPHGTKLVYPCELEALFGIRVRPLSSIDAIVFPSFNTVLERPSVRRLTPDETERRLTELHFEVPVQHAEFIPRAEFPVDRTIQTAALKQVCGRVPAFEFLYSFARLRRDAHVLREAIREQIGGS